jgi:hypothetical protein
VVYDAFCSKPYHGFLTLLLESIAAQEQIKLLNGFRLYSQGEIAWHSLTKDLYEHELEISSKIVGTSINIYDSKYRISYDLGQIGELTKDNQPIVLPSNNNVFDINNIQQRFYYAIKFFRHLIYLTFGDHRSKISHLYAKRITIRRRSGAVRRGTPRRTTHIKTSYGPPEP